VNQSEYRRKAVTTAVHDTREKALTCFLFGLLGEWSELEDKINMGARDELIKKELGDFVWYLVNYAEKLGVKKFRPVYASFMSEEPWKVIAEFQEINKKWYRDKNWELDEADVKLAAEYLSKLYAFFNAMCEARNYNRSDIFTMNIEKLFSRKARGKISGAGDER
jgi:NTP pyrophosphatase (non-canonical NTP hydrolase)